MGRDAGRGRGARGHREGGVRNGGGGLELLALGGAAGSPWLRPSRSGRPGPGPGTGCGCLGPEGTERTPRGPSLALSRNRRAARPVCVWGGGGTAGKGAGCKPVPRWGPGGVPGCQSAQSGVPRRPRRQRREEARSRREARRRRSRPGGERLATRAAGALGHALTRRAGHRLLGRREPGPSVYGHTTLNAPDLV